MSWSALRGFASVPASLHQAAKSSQPNASASVAAAAATRAQSARLKVFRPGLSVARPREPAAKPVVQRREGQSGKDLHQEQATLRGPRRLWVLGGPQRRQEGPNRGVVAEHSNPAAVGRLHAAADPADYRYGNPLDRAHARRVGNQGGLIERQEGHAGR